jgi:hypothetical protein
MIRMVTIASVFLLATSPVVCSGDRDAATLNVVLKQRNLHRIDMSLSPQEYKEVSSRNRKIVLKNLKSFSGNALKSIGVPKQGIDIVGATLGAVYNNGAKMDLNKSKTLALEVKDMVGSERALFLGVKLGW